MLVCMNDINQISNYNNSAYIKMTPAEESPCNTNRLYELYSLGGTQNALVVSYI